MRFFYALAAFALLSTSAVAQRATIQFLPQLGVDGSDALDTIIFNFTPDLPPTYYPQPEGTPLPPPNEAFPAQWIGASLFTRVEANGDTTDVGVVYAETDSYKNAVVARKADGTEALGCVDATPNSPPDFTNGADMVGKIVMIRRGVCSFVFKVANAQAAGAAGVVIYNGLDREGPEGPLADVVGNMGGAPEYAGAPFTIPAVLVSNGIGQPIVDEIVAGGSVNLGIVQQGGTITPITSAAEPTTGTTASGLVVSGANPFATTTQLRVTSEFAETVRVEVYNVRGQLVQTLLDGVVSGERLVTLSSERLAAGVYFVRATGETFRSQQQVTVLR